VVATLPPRAALVRADRDRVMQVMLNLLSNAVKFCEPGAGRVEVRLSQADPRTVRVDVIDNGIGIGREHQQVIFEKFRQVGDTLTQKPAGTGLGLAICRQIISRLGGRLWVESEPGRGSTFSFTLPAAHAQSMQRTAEAAE
jgi:signal transduction histidine kinase